MGPMREATSSLLGAGVKSEESDSASMRRRPPSSLALYRSSCWARMVQASRAGSIAPVRVLK